MEALGYTRHIRVFGSYSKLVGEGISLLNGDLIGIMEELLPRRLGGSPLDYQLIEEEDDNGMTRLSLLVAPSIRLADGDEPVRLILDALAKGDDASRFAGGVWRQAGTLKVRRIAPIVSSRGKQSPLLRVKRGAFSRG
jgi:hypothetical protein